MISQNNLPKEIDPYLSPSFPHGGAATTWQYGPMLKARQSQYATGRTGEKVTMSGRMGEEVRK